MVDDAEGHEVIEIGSAVRVRVELLDKWLVTLMP